jgi:hypothetical protein
MGYLAQIETYQTACENFQVELIGDESNINFDFNGENIGKFTWDDIDSDTLEIGFKPKSPKQNGITEMKFKIQNGAGVISTECSGDHECLSGVIKFNPTQKAEANLFLKDGNVKKKAHLNSYRNEEAIEIVASHNNVMTQISNNPKGRDFKVCSHNYEDAMIGATFAKLRQLKPCKSCLTTCKSDIISFCESSSCHFEFSSCLKPCWYECQGMYDS